MNITITRIGNAEMYGRSITRYEVTAPESAARRDVEAEVRCQFPTVHTPVGMGSVQNFAAYKDGWHFEWHQEH